MENISEIRVPTPAEWDCMLAFALENGVNIHWQDALSWCKADSPEFMSQCLRGYYHRDSSIMKFIDSRSPLCGFRPVFVSEKPTLTPGSTIVIGRVFLGDVRLEYDSDKAVRHLYLPNQTLTFAQIYDSEQSGGLEALSLGDVLIATSNVVLGISWCDLDRLGFTK